MSRSVLTYLPLLSNLLLKDASDGAAMNTRNQFSYDMFVNWSWDKLYEYQTWPWEEMVMRPKAEKSATKLEFKPS